MLIQGFFCVIYILVVDLNLGIVSKYFFHDVILLTFF